MVIKEFLFKMKKEERNKAIAIPISIINDGKPPRFLTVKDRRYQEWTFVTGGCRKREIINPLRCALRELEEETRGVVNLKSGTYRYFNFTHSILSNNTKKSEDPESPPTMIDITYHVYILDFNINKNEQNKIINKFNDAKVKLEKLKYQNYPIKMVYDENDVMNFETLEEFKTRDKVWPLIRHHILNNKEFYSTLGTQNRSTFNI